MITFGSLFAGIGGFDLGLERCGMQCKWQVEIDDYATKILERHWPDVHRQRDIKQCGRNNLERVDVICGGFPCQDISYAGKGAGLDGERSGLFFEAIRLVRELRPRAVVLENVAGLLTRGLDRVLWTLAEIGFDAEWHCIPAAAFNHNHLRERWFVLAYSDNRNRFHADGLEQYRRKRGQKNAFATWTHVVDRDQTEQEPGIPRVANGVPNQLDRLRCLGNAIVPQVAEVVGRILLERIGGEDDLFRN